MTGIVRSLRWRLTLAAAAALAIAVSIGYLGLYFAFSEAARAGSDASTNQLLTTVMTSLAGFSLLLVVFGGFLAYWLAGQILSPVRTIAETARSLSDRDLHRRVPLVASDSELVDLAATFNGMLERLEASFEGLRRFTGDASHELRAPLALMRTEVDLALSQPRTEAEYRTALQEVRVEVDHLTRVTDQLLLLARADAGSLQPAREPIDVADFVHEVASRWRARARARSLTIGVEVPDSGQAEADPSLLRRILDNLLENAVRHSPSGGTIGLRAARSDASWLFEVSDGGPGVPAELRDRLFTRFSRGPRAREPEGGAGLGLALSAAIATAHGGRLRLKPETQRGATFQLEIPA